MTMVAAKPQATAGTAPARTAGARGAVPVPPAAPPGRSRRTVPLTPMRQQAAKSMRKLAEGIQRDHPELAIHDHVRDAARTLESGNEEASQRHLRAAMFSLTPHSLHRNGVHDDIGHISARQAVHGVHRHLLLVKDIVDVAAKNQAAIRRDSYGDYESAPSLPHADPNAGYGPGALAAKPTQRQPGGNRALNAPDRTNSGGSDPAVADPVGPQPRGSKQFSTWDEVCRVIELVGPKGYVHGWIFVGVPSPGDKVTIPGKGTGKVSGGNATHAHVKMPDGSVHRIPHDKGSTKPARLVPSPKPAPPSSPAPGKRDDAANRRVAEASMAKGETLFHGTNHEFKPGDIIDAKHANARVTSLHEGKQYAFASTDAGEATFAGKVSRGGHVYRVEPVDNKYEFDPHQGSTTSRRTTGGFRVVEEVKQWSGEKMAPDPAVDLKQKGALNNVTNANRLKILKQMSPAEKKTYAKTGMLPAHITLSTGAYSWNDLAAVIDLSARTAQLEVTPAPYGKPGGPGLYGVKGNKHSDYFEQIVKALMEKRGMDKGRASAIAWGALRKWMRGGGGVHPEVRAAATGALAEEKAAQARAHGHAVTWDGVGSVIELFNPAQPRVAAGSAGGGQFAAGSTGAAPTNQKPVGSGASGKQVSDLQKRLNALGYKPPLKVDGKFGPATLAAVKAFQKSHGLKVDGLVGPNTTGALRGKTTAVKASAKHPAAKKAPAKVTAASLISKSLAAKPTAGAKAPAAKKTAAAPKAAKAPAAPKAAAAPKPSAAAAKAVPPAIVPAAASAQPAPPASSIGPVANAPAAAQPPAPPAPATPAAAIAVALQKAQTATSASTPPAVAAPMSAAPVFNKNGSVTAQVGGRKMTMSVRQWQTLRRAQLQAAGHP